MKYALLIYGPNAASAEDSESTRELDPRLAAVLGAPSVVDWVRLQHVESATTVRLKEGKRLFTDGPFLDSKEFLGGFVLVEAADLDGALAIAEELQEVRPQVVIEVRPVFETAEQYGDR